jgi:hypothetical protein
MNNIGFGPVKIPLWFSPRFVQVKGELSEAIVDALAFVV